VSTGACAIRPGYEGLDRTECGQPSAFVLKDRNGNDWGSCHQHVLATLVVMAPNAPVTVQPVGMHLPSVEEALSVTMRPGHLTEPQHQALTDLHRRYRVKYDPDHFRPAFDLPTGYVAGWVGGLSEKKLYVGVSPEGDVSS
jgi:hypothetical protein